MSCLSSEAGVKGFTRKTGRRLKPKSWPSLRERKARNRMKQALLLDDNAAQLTVRELVLRRAEVETHVATKAQSALALLRSGPGKDKIGVVITDHLMPDMDGAEFVRQLRSFNPKVPVIVISGLSEAESEYAGMDVIFRTKPCEPEDLIHLVKTALKDPKCRASA
jgi:CheY-like chemotaxis protein